MAQVLCVLSDAEYLTYYLALVNIQFNWVQVGASRGMAALL